VTCTVSDAAAVNEKAHVAVVLAMAQDCTASQSIDCARAFAARTRPTASVPSRMRRPIIDDAPNLVVPVMAEIRAHMAGPP
jgi:hypothetical protein